MSDDEEVTLPLQVDGANDDDPTEDNEGDKENKEQTEETGSAEQPEAVATEAEQAVETVSAPVAAPEGEMPANIMEVIIFNFSFPDCSN